MFKALVLFALFSLDTEAVHLKHKAVHKHISFKPMMAQLMGPTAEDIMSEFDQDEDNEISKKEFLDTLDRMSKKHGMVMTPEDWEAAEADFEAADKDNSGTISYEELEEEMG